MTTWLQRVRGAIGIGLTWAVAWAPVGATTGFVVGKVLGYPLGVVTANYTVTFAILGFVGGFIFSTVLRFAERRQTFNGLSMPRFVTWGALGGLMLGGLAVTISLLGAGFNAFGAVMIGASTLLGSGSAAGTLAIARAARRDDSLSGGDLSDATLMRKPARQRLANTE